MKISIVGLENQRGASTNFDFYAPAPNLITPDGEKVKSLGPLHLSGTLTNIGAGFLLKGTVKAKLEFVCARCLERYQATLQVDLEENYTKEDQKEDFRNFSGDEIILDEAVLEGLNLSMPLRGFCSEDCRGLCPQCGINRNLSSCDCREETIDPRLAVLGKLLKTPGGGGKNGST